MQLIGRVDRWSAESEFSSRAEVMKNSFKFVATEKAVYINTTGIVIEYQKITFSSRLMERKKRSVIKEGSMPLYMPLEICL